MDLGWYGLGGGLGVGKAVGLVFCASLAVIGTRCSPSEEILSYVMVQVDPPQPGLPRPRFSLYLSAQLQIGVIRVYSQQCQYLVGKTGKALPRWGRAKWPSARLALPILCSVPPTEDIQHILERLHRAQLQIRIDMVDTDL